MARRLYKRQEKLLVGWLVENRENLSIFYNFAEMLPMYLWQELEEINCFEDMYSHVNRFCSDWISKNVGF